MSGSIFPTDLTVSVFDPLKSPDNASSAQAILRPNNPARGVAGFVFGVPEDEILRLRTQISDHYLEDNTAIADQMSLEPERFIVRGLVGELLAGSTPNDETTAPANPLPLQPGMSPQLSPASTQRAQITADEAQATRAGIESAKSLYGYFDTNAPQPPGMTKQTKIVRYFYELWKSRQLFTVETPWGFFDNMAIEYLTATQPGESKFYSSFEITFKKMRIASLVTISAGQLAGRLNQQMAPVTQSGNAGTTPATPQQQSILSQLFSP